MENEKYILKVLEENVFRKSVEVVYRRDKLCDIENGRSFDQSRRAAKKAR